MVVGISFLFPFSFSKSYSGRIENTEFYNDPFSNGSRVRLELNMRSTPSTLHLFIDGRQQPVYITHLPESVRFSVCSTHMISLLFHFDTQFSFEDRFSSFEILKFKQIEESTATHVPGERALPFAQVLCGSQENFIDQKGRVNNITVSPSTNSFCAPLYSMVKNRVGLHPAARGRSLTLPMTLPMESGIWRFECRIVHNNILRGLFLYFILALIHFSGVGVVSETEQPIEYVMGLSADSVVYDGIEFTFF